MFNIDTFISNNKSFVFPNLYVVTVDGKVSMLAYGVQVPTRIIKTRSDMTYAVGHELKQPFATETTTLTLSLYTSFDGALKETDNLFYYNDWCYGKGDKSIIKSSGMTMAERPVRYVHDITRDIVIELYSANGTVLTTWNCKQCFPISVNVDQLSYAPASNLLSMSVELEVEDVIQVLGAGSGGSSFASPFQGGFVKGGLTTNGKSGSSNGGFDMPPLGSLSKIGSNVPTPGDLKDIGKIGDIAKDTLGDGLGKIKDTLGTDLPSNKNQSTIGSINDLKNDMNDKLNASIGELKQKNIPNVTNADLDNMKNSIMVSTNNNANDIYKSMQVSTPSNQNTNAIGAIEDMRSDTSKDIDKSVGDVASKSKFGKVLNLFGL